MALAGGGWKTSSCGEVARETCMHVFRQACEVIPTCG